MIKNDQEVMIDHRFSLIVSVLLFKGTQFLTMISSNYMFLGDKWTFWEFWGIEELRKYLFI